jgi:hypothetical protein
MGGMKARAPKNHADDWAASRFVELAARAEKMGEEDARKHWDSLQPEQRESWRARFLKAIEQERDLGRVVMEKIFRIEGREFSTQPLEAALNSLNCATVEELFLAVGQGRVSPNDVLLAAFGVSANNVSSLTRHRRRLAENKKPGYTRKGPSSSPADTSTEGMRDDFNRDLAVSRYELLARHVDLLNPRLSEAVKLTRAERLLKAYSRLRQAEPDFRDTGEQLRAARRIHMAGYRQRKREGQAPAVRGRPRKLHM